MAYSLEDIKVCEAGVALIRLRPDMYGGPASRARNLAAYMAGDLLKFGMKSVTIDLIGGWWLCGQHL